ncbi:hypothetical protein QO003_003085 [Arthrobacter silviterrae]|nr:hypothetical protein [Arthrobacter silviterrae]
MRECSAGSAVNCCAIWKKSLTIESLNVFT